MTNEKRTPRPLEDARYGLAMTAGLGFFDSAGWAPPVMPQAALNNGGSGRRDYGPKGCAGFAVLPALLATLALLFRRGGRRG